VIYHAGSLLAAEASIGADAHRLWQMLATSCQQAAVRVEPILRHSAEQLVAILRPGKIATDTDESRFAVRLPTDAERALDPGGQRIENNLPEAAGSQRLLIG